MVIEAAARRRDMLAWQITRGAKDGSVRSFADLVGSDEPAPEPPKVMSPTLVRHNLKLWQGALRPKPAESA